MILYLIRHAKDDDSIRGGWSHHSLTEEGRQQARLLAEFIKKQETTSKSKRFIPAIFLVQWKQLLKSLSF